MSTDIADLARRLAREAEAVCRHHLSNGRRQGRYWIVGDINNVPGRSLYVRLHGPDKGNGAAGKWTDYVALLYLVHAITRKSLGDMTRKLSVTESHRSAQFRGTVSRRKSRVASANWVQVA